MARHIGANIKALRRKIGLTQDDMAVKLGLVRPTYASKEQRGDFSKDELRTIAKAINVSIAMLTEDDELDERAITITNKDLTYWENQQELIDMQKKVIKQLEGKVQKLEEDILELKSKNTGGQRQSA